MADAENFEGMKLRYCLKSSIVVHENGMGSKMKWTRNWAPVGQKNKVCKEKEHKEVIINTGLEMEMVFVSVVGTATTA